ncbi:MAG: hypothetical protein PHF86_04855 [Candidatus Nanoarchaeia archaeon]|jgi:hypothetical protein|nr:hypothetical protein [Candidatus Nanoarchaeia archaeon]
MLSERCKYCVHRDDNERVSHWQQNFSCIKCAGLSSLVFFKLDRTQINKTVVEKPRPSAAGRFKFVFKDMYDEKKQDDNRKQYVQDLVNKLAALHRSQLTRFVGLLERIKEFKDVEPWQWVWYDCDNPITWPELGVPVLVMVGQAYNRYYMVLERRVLERNGSVDKCCWFMHVENWFLRDDMNVVCWCLIGPPPVLPAPVPTAIPI